MNVFLTCDVWLLVRKVCVPNQPNHVIGHLVLVAEKDGCTFSYELIDVHVLNTC